LRNHTLAERREFKTRIGTTHVDWYVDLNPIPNPNPYPNPAPNHACGLVRGSFGFCRRPAGLFQVLEAKLW
jgi:hypothetical protein